MDSYRNLLSPTPKRDPNLSKTALAIAKHPEANLSLDGMDWNLRSPELLQTLSANTQGLLLFSDDIDLKWLLRFTNLKRLSLTGKMKNWQALAELPNLQMLEVGGFAAGKQFKDLSFLGDSKLEVLNLNNCHLDSVAHLAKLKQLQQINIHARVAEFESWQALASLGRLQRARVHTYGQFSVPDLRQFPELSYLAVHAQGITFDPADFLNAPALQALALDGAAYQFLASPQGYLPDAPERWNEQLLSMSTAHTSLPGHQLKRVFLGTLPAGTRQRLAQWLQVPVVRTEEQLLKKNLVVIYNDKLEANAERQYDRAAGVIQKRVKAAVGRKCLLTYEAYDLDAAGLPRDNLDEPCWQGRCRIVGEETDDTPAFRSAELHDPTWLQVAVIANQMLCMRPATEHRFFEGIAEMGVEQDVAELMIQMGS
jgi:hypothetical protein